MTRQLFVLLVVLCTVAWGFAPARLSASAQAPRTITVGLYADAISLDPEDSNDNLSLGVEREIYDEARQDYHSELLLVATPDIRQITTTGYDKWGNTVSELGALARDEALAPASYPDLDPYVASVSTSANRAALLSTTMRPTSM